MLLGWSRFTQPKPLVQETKLPVSMCSTIIYFVNNNSNNK